MDDIISNRVPPQAIEVEESVLGAMLMDNEALVMALDRLEPRDFYKPENRLVFKALECLHEDGGDTDILSVEQWLRSKELLVEVGGSGYISGLTRSVSSAANIDYHAQIISEKATLRDVILGGSELVKDAYSPDADPYDVLDKMKEIQQEIEKRSYLEIPQSSSKKAAEVLQDTIEERNVKDGMVGVPAYLPIDLLTAGFPKKELCYIAARPSMGKTGYMLTIVKNLLENGFSEPILIFSYEMDAGILILRLLCMMAKVNMHFARRGKLDAEEKGRLIKAAKRFGIDASWDQDTNKITIHSIENSMLFIEDDNEIDVDRMGAKTRRIKAEHGLGIVMVDYLQLVPVRNPRQKNLGTREQEVAYISKSLKKYAKAFDVPIIPLSQLSRKVEDRPGDNRPNLGDLRESGSIEQDATMVMFLYRPEYYDIKRTEEGVSTKGLCEVILKKNRNGPVGTRKHEFIKDYALFREWDEEKAALRDGSGDPQQAMWMQGRDDPGENPTEEIDLEEDAPF